jgi:DNA-binding NarL/FixJ family response regulator
MRTYLIEPQSLFVPYLTRLLSDAGLMIVATNDDVDPRDLTAHTPAAVIVDVDFFERGAPTALCRIRQAVGSAVIVAFSDADDADFEAACHICGANAVVSKRASAEGLLRALRAALSAGAAA